MSEWTDLADYCRRAKIAPKTAYNQICRGKFPLTIHRTEKGSKRGDIRLVKAEVEAYFAGETAVNG